MKKNVLICMLVLAMIFTLAGCGCKHEWAEATCEVAKTCNLCGEIQGAALGHTWQEATCTEAKTCATCQATEGEAIGHTWEEATTELPQTCSVCQATEGTKLETDSRFTTASTKVLQGMWYCDVTLTDEMMGLADFGGMDCKMTLSFSNIGDMSMKLELKDEAEFMQKYKAWTVKLLYATFAAVGMNEEQTDAAMIEEYGLTTEEYVDASLENYDVSEMLSAFNYDNVYYVENDELFTAMTWKAKFTSDAFSITDGKLVIEGVTLEDGGANLVWSRDVI